MNDFIKRCQCLLIVLVLFLFLPFHACSKKKSHMVHSWTERTFFVLDTFLTISLPPKDFSDHMIEEMITMVHDTDKKLNVYTVGSDLYRIRQNAGYVPVSIDSETVFILQKAISFCQQTDGVFDITVGPFVDLYRFHDEHHYVPTQKEIDETRPLVNYREIVLDETSKTVFLPIKGMYIDLSSILKGYLLDKISDFFLRKDIQNFYVNFGGNLSLSLEEALYIGIENPFHKSSQEGFFCSQGFISTSSATHQFFYQGTKRYCHIIHPFTGSAEPIIGSATVVTWSGIESDFLSTYFFLVGEHPQQEVQKQYVSQSSIFLYTLEEVFTIYAENHCP
jgi:FAD:protein FMN transferase